jgi:Xaa-Pro dipeptidase
VSAPGPLLDPARLPEVSRLLGEVGADGWLLYDFRDQNPLAHSLLGLEKTTRRAFALFPRDGPPRLLHHAIEASAWRRWPWHRRTYAGWRELGEELKRLLAGVETVAMEISPGDAVPTVDRVPAGIAELVAAAGARAVSSGDLVSHFHSRWSARGLELHRTAAGVVRDTAHAAFQRAAAAAGAGDPLAEGELMGWIRERLREGGLTDQEDCIVAVGANAADPHYHPDGVGSTLDADALVLIDLWGRHPGEGVPADQTWMGYLGETPPARTLEVWEVVRDARDLALRFMAERGERGEAARGWEVDHVARRFVEEKGFGRYFVHRLGHSLDHQLHGSGPNLDHLETRDERRLLPGVGFSVEPGIYIPGRIGVRSEVNVHWGEDGPEVTTPEPQRDLLVFPPD